MSDSDRVVPLHPIPEVSQEERAHRLQAEVERLSGLSTVEWMFYLDGTAEKHGVDKATLKQMVERVIKENEKKQHDEQAERRRSEERKERKQEREDEKKQQIDRQAKKDANRKAEKKDRERQREFSQNGSASASALGWTHAADRHCGYGTQAAWNRATELCRSRNTLDPSNIFHAMSQARC